MFLRVAGGGASGRAHRYVATYTKCYDMCTQREPHSWSIQLYERHGSSLRHYLHMVALTAIVAQPESPPHVMLHECVSLRARIHAHTHTHTLHVRMHRAHALTQTRKYALRTRATI
jgi:hypothetical protein